MELVQEGTWLEGREGRHVSELLGWLHGSRVCRGDCVCVSVFVIYFMVSNLIST